MTGNKSGKVQAGEVLKLHNRKSNLLTYFLKNVFD